MNECPTGISFGTILRIQSLCAMLLLPALSDVPPGAVREVSCKDNRCQPEKIPSGFPNPKPEFTLRKS